MNELGFRIWSSLSMRRSRGFVLCGFISVETVFRDCISSLSESFRFDGFQVIGSLFRQHRVDRHAAAEFKSGRGRQSRQDFDVP